MNELNMNPPAIVAQAQAPFVEYSIEKITGFIHAELGKSALSVWRLGKMLNLAKAKVKLGEFGKYLEKEFPNLSYPTLNRYMRVADKFNEDQLKDGEPLTGLFGYGAGKNNKDGGDKMKKTSIATDNIEKALATINDLLGRADNVWAILMYWATARGS